MHEKRKLRVLRWRSMSPERKAAGKKIEKDYGPVIARINTVGGVLEDTTLLTPLCDPKSWHSGVLHEDVQLGFPTRDWENIWKTLAPTDQNLLHRAIGKAAKLHIMTVGDLRKAKEHSLIYPNVNAPNYVKGSNMGPTMAKVLKGAFEKRENGSTSTSSMR
jgi:hypothetical protein